MSELVFVYGTLRQGEVNHHLLSHTDFCGTYTTLPRYRMLHLGSYPGVVTSGSSAIVGEVYRVTRKTLVKLDQLENYPRLYTRKLISTSWGSAWIYLYRGARISRSVIPHGDWRGQQRPGPFSLY